MIHFAMMNPFLIIVLLVSMLIATIPTLIALIDILRNKFKGNDKMVWVLVVLFFNIIGAILYFVIGRKQKLKTSVYTPSGTDS